MITVILHFDDVIAYQEHFWAFCFLEINLCVQNDRKSSDVLPFETKRVMIFVYLPFDGKQEMA